MFDSLVLNRELKSGMEAAVESGFYNSREELLSDAVRTLLAARPDLRLSIAAKLYARGVFSLGKAAEWSGVSIETMKSELFRRGIPRSAPDRVDDLRVMAEQALSSVGGTPV